ncbi:hypothetical protein GQR58_030671 [Nymphon striatum]|nr:hypothetical protein GQR58_030671 [Nymphon striatum]
MRGEFPPTRSRMDYGRRRRASCGSQDSQDEHVHPHEIERSSISFWVASWRLRLTYSRARRVRASPSSSSTLSSMWSGWGSTGAWFKPPANARASPGWQRGRTEPRSTSSGAEFLPGIGALPKDRIPRWGPTTPRRNRSESVELLGRPILDRIAVARPIVRARVVCPGCCRQVVPAHALAPAVTTASASTNSVSSSAWVRLRFVLRSRSTCLDPDPAQLATVPRRDRQPLMDFAARCSRFLAFRPRSSTRSSIVPGQIRR